MKRYFSTSRSSFIFFLMKGQASLLIKFNTWLIIFNNLCIKSLPYNFYIKNWIWNTQIFCVLYCSFFCLNLVRIFKLCWLELFYFMIVSYKLILLDKSLYNNKNNKLKYIFLQQFLEAFNFHKRWRNYEIDTILYFQKIYLFDFNIISYFTLRSDDRAVLKDSS